MSTLTALTTLTKSLYRETTTELDSFIQSSLNRNYKKWARKFPWKQLLVENASLTLTAGTEQYALPSAFWRMVEDSVRYDVTTGDNGIKIKIISTDDLAIYKLLNDQSRPMVCSVVEASSAGPTKRLEFAPGFTETNKTVLYDYFKTPTTLTGSDSFEVEELEEVIMYEAMFELAIYHKDKDLAAIYLSQAKDFRNTMIQQFIL